MKLLLKLNPRLFLLETIAFIFIVQGSRCLNISYHAEQWEAILQNDSQKFNNISAISQFLFQGAMWSIYTLLCLAVLMILVKLLTKRSSANTLMSFLLVFILFPTRLMNELSPVYNSVGYFFSDDLKTAFLTGGILMTTMGAILAWTTIIKDQGKSQRQTTVRSEKST